MSNRPHVDPLHPMKTLQRRAAAARLLRLACAALLWPAAGRAQEGAAAPDADKVRAMLERCDGYRNPDFSYSARVVLTEFKAGQKGDALTLRLYARPAGQKGQFHTLVSFLQPARELGKHMLKAGSDVWFYDPASSASIRLSPMQRLLGQAANADVVSTSFSAEYQPRFKAAESIVDGDRQRRAAWQLELTPLQAGVGYARIVLWLDAESAAPLRARFYSDSGALLKTVFYRRPREELGLVRPTEYVIIDGTDPKSVTLMQFDEYKAVDVPAQWMQKDSLPLLKVSP